MKIVFTLINLFGCAAKTFYVNEKYANVKFDQDAIFVLPISDSDIKVNISEHCIDDFGPFKDKGCEAVLADTFNVNFYASAKKSMSKLKVWDSKKIILGSNTTTYDTILNQTSNKPLRFSFTIPKLELLKNEGRAPRYILITDNLVFDTESTSTAPVMGANGAMMGGGSSKSINLDLNYLVWDYSTNEAVGFGTSNGSASANFFITRSDWISIMEETARDAAWKLPFAIKKGEPSY